MKQQGLEDMRFVKYRKLTDDKALPEKTDLIFLRQNNTEIVRTYYPMKPKSDNLKSTNFKLTVSSVFVNMGIGSINPQRRWNGCIQPTQYGSLYRTG